MRYLIIPLVIGLAVFVACVDTTGTGDGVPHDQTTVLGTLLLFEDVWNSGNIDTYRGLLDMEDFIFYFDPADVGGDIPISWKYNDEIEAFSKLFGAVGAENVAVTLDLSGVAEPEEWAQIYRVEEVPYEVYVYVESEFGDTTYIAKANLDMQFKKVDGEWVITKWWDKDTDKLLIEHTTWGEIKANF